MTEYAAAEDRLEMLRLACANEPLFEVCDYELRSDRVSYTIYTIEYFRSRFPDDELFLLVGSDMLLSFDKWFCYEKILAQASLCVISRHDGDSAELKKKSQELKKLGKIYVSESLPLVISSTEIRKKIAKNKDFTCYLDKNVVQYIRLKGLYSLRGDKKMLYDPETKKKYLKENLSAKRYTHSLNVAEECRKLAERYGEDPNKAYFAGLLHDICKELPSDEQKRLADNNVFTVCREELETRSLWHAVAGAYFIKTEFRIEDIDILNAVRFHTVGRGWHEPA